jgi:hypothetical protein
VTAITFRTFVSGKGKTVTIACSTGIASTHYGKIGGTTLHKWSGIGDDRYLNEEIVHLIKTNERSLAKSNAVCWSSSSMFTFWCFPELYSTVKWNSLTTVGIFHENFLLKQEIRRNLHRIYNFGFLINGSLLWTITLIWRQIRFPETKVPNVTVVFIKWTISSFKYQSSPIPDHLCNVVPPNLP